jgi:hypothetical protein
MKEVSRYVVVVDNLSGNTPTKDIEYEFSYAGKIRCVVCCVCGAAHMCGLRVAAAGCDWQ